MTIANNRQRHNVADTANKLKAKRERVIFLSLAGGDGVDRASRMSMRASGLCLDTKPSGGQMIIRCTSFAICRRVRERKDETEYTAQ